MDKIKAVKCELYEMVRDCDIGEEAAIDMDLGPDDLGALLIAYISNTSQKSCMKTAEKAIIEEYLEEYLENRNLEFSDWYSVGDEVFEVVVTHIMEKSIDQVVYRLVF